MLAIVAPGQGAQQPAFLAEWLELGGWSGRLSGWSAAAGVDLLAAGTTADRAQIRDTAVGQPLLVAAALASAAELGEADVLVGHSVGEFAAAALAGVIAPDTTLTLIRTRATAMAAACHAPVATGMSAVIGGAAAEVIDRLTALGLEVANCNGGGQIVAAGRRDALDRLAADPPPGARIRPLDVDGAFHTPWMSAAQATMASAVDGVSTADPHTLLLSNADGAVVHTGSQMLGRLIAQMTAPVRFDQCLATLRRLGVTGVIELLPGGMLSGLIRRELPDAEVIAVRRPADLIAARSLATAHREATPAEHTPLWRLVVATTNGSFVRAPHPVGATMVAGTELGQLRGRRDSAPVLVPSPGVLVEWLVEDGDPIYVGQPLARWHPQGTHEETAAVAGCS